MGGTAKKIKGTFTHPFTMFVSKKFAFYLVTALVAISLIIVLPRLMPGNPVDLMLAGQSSQVGDVTIDIAKIRASASAYFGLDKPLDAYYIDRFAGILQGDLGRSYFTYGNRPVLGILLESLPFTLSLVIPVLIITFFLGNWIGARAAFLRGRRNTSVFYLALIANQMPLFWFGMILSFIFAVNFGLFPVYGWHTMGMIPNLSFDFILDVARHYVLPFLSLFVGGLGLWALGMRSLTLYEANQDYIFYFQSLGFKENKLRSYAQRNAILPQVTGANLALSSLIMATLIIEIIFGWPGFGMVFLKSVLNREYPLLLGTFLVTVLVVLVGNFVIDILYGKIDPRIRTSTRGE